MEIPNTKFDTRKRQFTQVTADELQEALKSMWSTPLRWDGPTTKAKQDIELLATPRSVGPPSTFPLARLRTGVGRPKVAFPPPVFGVRECRVTFGAWAIFIRALAVRLAHKTHIGRIVSK